MTSNFSTLVNNQLASCPILSKVTGWSHPQTKAVIHTCSFRKLQAAWSKACGCLWWWTPRGALLINKDRGLSPSKISAPQKSKNLSFYKPKKVNSWNFQTQKSKLLYFDPVLPKCCSSRSLQIIFMALATVFRITLAFWNYLRKIFAIRYLVEALLVITVNFSHYLLVNGQKKVNRKGLVTMRCLISNKSNHLIYIVLELNTFGRSVATACEKVISVFERSLIAPEVRKLMSDTPVPGRPSNLSTKGLRPCEFMLYKLGKNWRSSIINHLTQCIECW